MEKYMSIKEATMKWGISERRIQKLCNEERISGAKRFGKAWVIPLNSSKPLDARKKRGNVKTKSSHVRINEELYGSGMKVLSQSESCNVYYIENSTGNGVVTNYNVFPGIQVYYNDFHMSDGFNHKRQECSDIIEINHCREGRFECEFASGGYAYLGEGDLAINMLNHPTDSSYFPLCHYHGISIVIDIASAKIAIDRLLSNFGNVKIEIDKIKERAISSNGCFIMRATDTIQHIFSELYNIPDEFREGYIKIKIVELLFFLVTLETTVFEERQYFNRGQVDTVKEIRGFIVSNLNTRFTLKELSEQFNISLTSMKICFKGVYGAPIATYMREYRFQVAAQMLRSSQLSIAEISEHVGYESPAKFSSYFQKKMKLTPSEYRRSIVKN